MTKKVLIYIGTRFDLKLFLPIIEEGIHREDIEVLLITYTESFSVKKDSYYLPEFNPFHDSMEVIYVDNENDLVETIVRLQVDILLASSLQVDAFEKIKQKSDLQLCYLQHSMDVVSTWPYVYSKNIYGLFDAFFVFSSYWKSEFVKEVKHCKILNKEELTLLKGKIYVVGFPELDGVNKLDNSLIRDKYGIGQNQKIVFFDPTGIVRHVPNTFYKYYFILYGSLWLKVIQLVRSILSDVRQYGLAFLFKIFTLIFKVYTSKKMPRYETIFFQLKEYCLEHDIFLVCKSRPKNNDPKWLKDNCDLFCYDQSYYPFTLLELLSISNYYVGFYSTSVLEAVYCNIPAKIFQSVPTKFQYERYGGNVYEYLEKCFETPGEWLNYQGVVDPCFWESSKNEMFLELSELSINMDARDKYVEKFLGFDDGQSSKRIFETITYMLTTMNFKGPEFVS